jgi:hypothetical protein
MGQVSGIKGVTPQDRAVGFVPYGRLWEAWSLLESRERGVRFVASAVEFLIAGDSAIRVGTAAFDDPTAAERWLEVRSIRFADTGIASFRGIIGALRSNRHD